MIWQGKMTFVTPHVAVLTSVLVPAEVGFPLFLFPHLFGVGAVQAGHARNENCDAQGDVQNDEQGNEDIHNAFRWDVPVAHNIG